MNAPLISIVIPTYNHAQLLKKALESVLAQSYPNWEAIVVDNCSEDNTSAIVAGFNDPRISYMTVSNHGVIAVSRNLGIVSSKGSWIAFLDSDDIWFPSRLKKIQEYIQKDASIDVWSTNEILSNVSSGQQKNIKYGPISNNMYQRLLKYGNCLSPSATLVKRSFLEENALLMRENAIFVTAEDYDFWLLLANAGAKFKFLNLFEGQYTIHSHNNSMQIKRHHNAIRNVLYDHVFNIQNFENKEKLWNQIKNRILIESSLWYLAKKKFTTGIFGLLKAGFASPIFFIKFSTLLIYTKFR
jgi:glycosyltransferase involved in cell wall biosynthesis